MLTAARGAGTDPSTASSAAADLAGAGGAGVIGGGGGNFPLAVALLAFAFANFINLLSIWCAPPFLPLLCLLDLNRTRGLGLVVGVDAIAPVPLSVLVLRWGVVATLDRVRDWFAKSCFFFTKLGLRVYSRVMCCGSKERALLL